jgi:hypothetical protein
VVASYRAEWRESSHENGAHSTMTEQKLARVRPSMRCNCRDCGACLLKGDRCARAKDRYTPYCSDCTLARFEAYFQSRLRELGPRR